MTTTRRDFLQTSAAAVAVTFVPGLLQAGPSQDRPRSNKGKIFKADKGGIIGRDEDAMVAKLQQYREAGFDGLEGSSPGMDVQALKRAMKRADMPVHGVVNSVHWNDRLSSPDPAVREKGLEALVQAIKDAREIEATSVLLVPGKVTGPDETHDDVWNRSIVEIRKALPVAEDRRIKVLIENVWNGFCESPDQFRDYVDEIESEWVGVYFDIGNVRKFGKPEDWIRLLGNRIGKLDIKDWSQEKGFCRLGEGAVDWPAVRTALDEIDYTGWGTREGRDNSLEDTSQLMDELLDL